MAIAAVAARPAGSVCGGRQQHTSTAARGKQHCGIVSAPNYGAGSAGGIVSTGSASDRHAHAGAASAARVTLDLQDCTFTGPALPEPFVGFELAGQLTRLGLLSNTQDKAFEQDWGALRRQFRSSGGPQSLCNHIIAPLATRLGFDPPAQEDEVSTREGMEGGGWIMRAPCGTRLRAWSFASGTDLDAPHRSGRAYRFSPMRSAQRVLLVTGERLGLLTDGDELRLLLCDPAYPDSHIAMPLAGSTGWRAQNFAPDSYRLLLALASPKGIVALPDVLEAARLSQSRITKDLRVQARSAIEGFLQAVLDNSANATEHDLHQRAASAVGRRVGLRLSPAVHPETGKPRRSGMRVQLCLHQPVAQRPVAESRVGAAGASNAGSWSPHWADVGRWNSPGVPHVS